MDTNLMNNQMKQLKRLGKDVEDLEKKLNKVFDDVDEVKSSSSGKGRNRCLKAPTEIKQTKPLPKAVMRNNKKRVIPKCQQKAKSATLEVTVKTKRHGKSSKSNVSSAIKSKDDSKSRNKPLEDIATSKDMQHCCCLLNSKNTTWNKILKNSEFSDTVAPNSREERIVSCEADCDDRGKGHFGNNCRNKISRLQSQEALSQPLMPNDGKEIVGSDLICNDLLNTRKCSKEDLKAQNNPQFFSDGGIKPQLTRNGADELNAINGCSPHLIKSLCMLIEELVRTNASHPTQTLVQDMETALKKLCKAANTSEASENSRSSFKKASTGELLNGTALKINKGTEDRMEISSAKPHLVTNVMVQVPSTDENNGFINGGRTKQDNLISQSDPIQNGQRKFAVAEKFELLVKVNDDDGTKRQYILGNDEKLKAEIEYLNKQLNLQLKSVEGLSTKESEYHKLITSLIEKVDKLETQVNEQTKVSQHFYGHCNSLLEQNSVIPKMQKKYDHLNRQLQDTIHNYEKLKIEYCMMKLEKEKYYTLNCEKDKELSRFKEELIKIQTLVAQQMQNVKSYVGYSSAAEKVDALLSLIDSQSKLIKSKISSAKELDEVNISALQSSSPSSSSHHSRPISPFSYSVTLNSPDKKCRIPNDADGKEGNGVSTNH